MIIDGIKIGHNQPTYFIADIAANHDGDISRAKDLIYKASEAGANAAKFQHFRADKIVSDVGFKSLGTRESHQSSWKKTVVEVYRDASVSLDWTQELKDTCVAAGITFFTSPYDIDLVDFIDPFVPAYKIGSGDITWHEIIQHIARKNKPYILATGASSMDEVVAAVEVGLQYNSNLALLQCNTNYTGSKDNFKYIHLNVLRSYREMFPNLILGLSDHTPGHSTVLGAVSLGARIIEKHFTDDVARIGPDHAFSMNQVGWAQMVESTRELEMALGDGIKRIEDNEKKTVILQRRSLRVMHSLPEGHILTREDLFPLRPNTEMAYKPNQIGLIIGKKLRIKKNIGESIDFGDLIE
jgi:N-acetylneuraminate synthase